MARTKKSARQGRNQQQASNNNSNENNTTETSNTGNKTDNNTVVTSTQNNNLPMAMMIPIVARDPRFRAGKALLQRGQCEQGATVFAALLEESIQRFGSDHLETVPAYYEYGHALFRAQQRREQQGDDSHVDDRKDAARLAAAAAAERRAQQAKVKDAIASDSTVQDDATDVKQSGEATDNADAVENSNGTGKSDGTDDAKQASVQVEATEKKQGENPTESKSVGEASVNDQNDDDDAKLALEMMENSWSILDRYLENPSSHDVSYLNWAKEQSPRFLIGIGDVLSSLERHPDAVDVYCRALSLRQEALPQSSTESLELLTKRRLVVEVNILIAEALLACPPDQDVVTSETREILVPAADRVDYARGYYDKAKDELQETVLLMGQLTARGNVDVTEAKEDVCFVATMVMGIGTALAELDEQQQEPAAKKTKTA